MYPSMKPAQIQQTLSTDEMPRALGVSSRTLRALRNQDKSPFRLGEHYRHRGITKDAPLQWFPTETDEAFTRFQVERWKDIETMDGQQ